MLAATATEGANAGSRPLSEAGAARRQAVGPAGGADGPPTEVGNLLALDAMLIDDFDTVEEAHGMVGRARALLSRQLTEAGWVGE